MLLSTFLSYAQKVKFKKDKLVIDDKEIMKIETTGTFGANGYTLYQLNGDKPLIDLISISNGTHMELSDDFTKIKFLTNGKKLEINGGNLKEAIKLMLKSELLKIDGTIDESKIDLFIENYDEKISDRTVIIR